MPIYEYICENCGHTLDELQSMKDAPLVKCPKCGKNTLKKLIGSGSGFIFKGSGFYATDYKKSKTSHSKSSSKKETKNVDTAPELNETKPKETKKESKTDTSKKNK